MSALGTARLQWFCQRQIASSGRFVAMQIFIIYTVFHKKAPLYFGPQFPCFVMDFHSSSTNGDRNECSIEELLNLQLHPQLRLHYLIKLKPVSLCAR